MAETDWLRGSVLYQVFLPSFADGDGSGDLKGATARLDHLQWFSVDAVWLNPCFDSPFRTPPARGLRGPRRTRRRGGRPVRLRVFHLRPGPGEGPGHGNGAGRAV